MSEKKENEKGNLKFPEMPEKEFETEEEEVEKLMQKSLKEQAEKKVAEAQPVSRKEMEEELAKLREENEDMKELFNRAKAQHKAIIRQRETDKTDELRKIYKGTAIDGMF